MEGRRWSVCERDSTRAVHDPGKIVADLAAAVALGGDCLADIAVLREQPQLAGPVASDPVVSRLVATLGRGPAPGAEGGPRSQCGSPRARLVAGRGRRARRGRRPGHRRPGRHRRDRAGAAPTAPAPPGPSPHRLGGGTNEFLTWLTAGSGRLRYSVGRASLSTSKGSDLWGLSPDHSRESRHQSPVRLAAPRYRMATSQDPSLGRRLRFRLGSVLPTRMYEVSPQYGRQTY